MEKPRSVTRDLFVLLGVFAIFGANNRVEAQSCVPECRQGYICHQGSCVSACNPPCAQGELCTAEHECLAIKVAPPARHVAPYSASDPAVQHSALVRERADLSATMPSITGPAVLMGIGGGLLIAGGAAFGASEWEGWYYGPGQYAGLSAMTIGGILVLVGVPLFAVNLNRRNSKKDRIRHIDRQLDLTMVPVFAPRADGERYGLKLRATF